jgi:hypothetical protein
LNSDEEQTKDGNQAEGGNAEGERHVNKRKRTLPMRQ